MPEGDRQNKIGNRSVELYDRLRIDPRIASYARYDNNVKRNSPSRIVERSQSSAQIDFSGIGRNEPPRKDRSGVGGELSDGGSAKPKARAKRGTGLQARYKQRLKELEEVFPGNPTNKATAKELARQDEDKKGNRNASRG